MKNMSRKLIFVILFSAVLTPVNGAAALSHGKTLANLSSNDLMFAQMMIPHHQQAIDMSKFALKNSSNKEIKALGREISGAQGKEIAQMKYWLSATKSSSAMGHDMGGMEGHDMGGMGDMGGMEGHNMEMDGMISDAQMRTLSTLKGPKFDKAFLKAMIEHHQGAIEMTSLLKGSKNSEAKKLASDVVRVQKSEITKMKKLLVKFA